MEATAKTLGVGPCLDPGPNVWCGRASASSLAEDSALTHVLITILGLGILFVILRSMIRIALINRHYRDFFAEFIGHAVHTAVALRLRRNRDTTAIHNVLLWVFPAYLLSLIVVYFVGAMTGFVLLYWGMHAVDTWRQAFLASGSALNTLGFATPATIAGQWLAIPEGALGLGIVMFLFTFIPTYQAVIRSREDKTSWLYVRTGNQPSGATLLQWRQRTGDVASMRDVWEAWEEWFRMLGDTHSVLPMLTMSPSVQSNQSWVVAAAAVLDAAALSASCTESGDAEAAKICVRTGTRAFLAIAEALGRASAAAECPLVEKYGSAACQDIQWKEFLSMREQYEEAVFFVARQTFAPLDGLLVVKR
jgi:hypothetical protein